MLDTNSEKEFMIHVEECKVMGTEERAKHLVCFCRDCHARFSTRVGEAHEVRGVLAHHDGHQQAV